MVDLPGSNFFVCEFETCHIITFTLDLIPSEKAWTHLSPLA